MVAERFQRLLFRGVVQDRIRHVTPVRYRDATGLVLDVYRQLEREFELVPPITVHSVVPEILAGVWSLVRESLVAGPTDRARREAVAAAVSQLNACPFCVDVHTTMLSAADRSDVVAGFTSASNDVIDDPNMRDLVRWAHATRSPGDPLLANPPFDEPEATQLRATAVGFHYINRVVNVFMYDGSPLRLPAGLGWFKPTLRRLAGRLVGRRVVRVQVSPGDAQNLPADHWSETAKLPKEYAWADTDTALAPAIARFASAIDGAANEAVSPPVRDVIQTAVEEWDGADPPLSRAWADQRIECLRETDRPAARLGLLVALASYQVDDDLISAFRRYDPSDAALLTLVSFASAKAAHRIASWLA